MFEYFTSIFSNISSYVYPGILSSSYSSSPYSISHSPLILDNDVIVKATISRIQTERIKNEICILRSDSNFIPKEYYIDFHFSLDTIKSYIQSTLSSPKESWRIRIWDDSWASSTDIGYIIELNELKTLATKKFWFFNLNLQQQQQLNSLFHAYSG